MKSQLWILRASIFTAGWLVAAFFAPLCGQIVVHGTPTGAGLRDGSDWANAVRLDSSNGLQDAWNRLDDGGKLLVGSGTYRTRQTLSIASGGSSMSSCKELSGVDTGAGRPVFQGTWAMGSADTTAFIRLSQGASFFLIENLEVRNYYTVVRAHNGPNFGYVIRQIDIYDTDYGLSLQGGATTALPESGSGDILLERIRITRFARRGIRIEGGHRDVIVNDCIVDAGGKEYDNPEYGFPMCFHVSNNKQNTRIVDRRITFNNCIANNAYNDRTPNYWQGDGFVSERPSRDLTFNNCLAMGNTDGGWDVKSATLILRDCVAFGNKRNFRIWSVESATMENCFSGYPINFGVPGSGSAVGVHANVNVPLTISRSTLLGAPHAEVLVLNGSRVTIRDSVILPLSSDSLCRNDDGGGLRITGSSLRVSDSRIPFAELTLENTTEFLPGVVGEDPRFNRPDPTWSGRGDAYNSAHFGPAKGYFRQTTVHLVGDSTMAVPPDDRRPQAGWGEMIDRHLKSTVRLRNHAAGGHSTKSFIDEGRWTALLAEARAGDVVIIQFSHNDQKDDNPALSAPARTLFRENLERFIADCRLRGLYPILASPIHRRLFSGGLIRNSHGDYPAVVGEVAHAERVAFVDMTARSEVLFNSLGVEGSKAIFVHLGHGEHPNFPSGREDNTHFSSHGAEVLANLFVEALAETQSPLLQLLRHRAVKTSLHHRIGGGILLVRDVYGTFFTVQSSSDLDRWTDLSRISTDNAGVGQYFFTAGKSPFFLMWRLEE